MGTTNANRAPRAASHRRKPLQLLPRFKRPSRYRGMATA